MVCLSIDLEVMASAVVYDQSGGVDKTLKVTLEPSKTVQSIYQEIEAEFQYHPDSFELEMRSSNGFTIFLCNYKEKTFHEIGDSFGNVKDSIYIKRTKDAARNMNLVVTGPFVTDAGGSNDDDLLLGASASPTANKTRCDSNRMSATWERRKMAAEGYEKQGQYIMAKLTEKDYPSYSISQDLFTYVGLVNQAMTCYLNSLLQALYMTPEFRNALYKWEFVGQQKKEADSIPFQLQKLFLNLQTSSHSAVETKELTQSFGWDLSEAWQQHDIQELCRVMFDALEQTFKETEQANLINDLYEGKMIDYVKCLECNTEKSREDTFLDIPLPVRPFGSSVAYNSVEEALRAFVQPETLDGNNQYHCEKCNKKCDAHKGLKFKQFPYLLTLHLKRFDFDYSTLHRIKLNDKVVFPEILNLNSFIPDATTACNVDNGSLEEHETIVKCDDCSTTDSGSALDDENCQVTDIPSTINGQEDSYQDEDEGIDVSSENHHHENEKNRQQEPSGPYIYELFSIMIHSGSASGGHYYAYIKDFQKNMWFCFNDSSVSHITQDDIQKSYGGGLMRTYYSGAYSSSTNAYMLMYRQIDSDRNDRAMQVDEFPDHIKELLQKMRNKEQCEKLAKEREYSSVKMKVYCFHPVSNQLVEFKLLLPRDTRVAEATREAYECLKLEGVVALADCRLVSYSKLEDVIEFSFGDEDRICDIAQSYIDNYTIDWLLEIKQPGTEFQIYKPGGVTMKVCYINLEAEEVAEPFSFRVQAEETVGQLKVRLSKFMNMDCSVMKLVQQLQQDSCSSEQHYLDIDANLVDFDHKCKSYKLYVADALDGEPDKPFFGSKLNRIIDRFSLMVTLEVILPETDIGTLESLSIPSLDLNQNLERAEPAAFTDRLNLRSSPQPACESVNDQSNSEDSSLSDSDRTLVGDAPGDSMGLLSSSSNSPADQHMVSPSDPAEDTYDHDVLSYNHSGCEDMSWEDDTADVFQKSQNYYFKASSISHTDRSLVVDATKCCTVYVDRRMTFGNLKKHLESIVGVPTEYFKLYKYSSLTEIKFLNDTLSSVRDGDRVVVKLGRVLKKDEFAGKIYHLTPENSNAFYFLFEWIIAKGQTVAQVKKEVLFAAKKQHMLDIHFGRSRLRNKNWKNPGKILLDDQRFVDDVPVKSNWEMFLQDLGEGEKVTKTSQLCLFVKRWCPSTFTLTPFHEIVLDRPTMDELKEKLAAESQIPKEFVDVLYIKGNFPCDMNILDIHEHLEWNPNVTDLDSCSLQIDEDGCVFLYRDSREVLKSLTSEEKKEIGQRENIRLRKFGSKFYSPKKERALRIYLDRSSNKSGETSGD